jgi:hypothetical protein
VAGCGGPPQARVRGRVTLDGEPLAHGTIAFLPADGKGPTAGGIVRLVRLVTAEDLILFKLLAGRPRDLLDIKDILFMQGQLDEAYMRRWAMPLGVAGQLELALAER